MYGIVANVLSDRALRTGAKVLLVHVNGDAEHPIVIGLSKSGHNILKYIPYKRLINYRAAWIPEHMITELGRRGWSLLIHYDTRTEAEQHANILAQMWAGIRSFTRDGKELRHEGAPVSEAFRRLS